LFFAEPGEAVAAPAGEVPGVQHHERQRIVGGADGEVVGRQVQRAERAVPPTVCSQRFTFGGVQPRKQNGGHPRACFLACVADHLVGIGGLAGVEEDERLLRPRVRQARGKSTLAGRGGGHFVEAPRFVEPPHVQRLPPSERRGLTQFVRCRLPMRARQGVANELVDLPCRHVFSSSCWPRYSISEHAAGSDGGFAVSLRDARRTLPMPAKERHDQKPQPCM